ncbi:MAG: hypothetical protein JW891_16155 [Candidatus Lokiarchaeota archaeon]|nr:hypothetical protein [Candidatus Lokiarchaeota archaeon]
MSDGKGGIVLGAIALIVAISGVGLWGYDTFISPINPEVDPASSLRAKAFMNYQRTYYEINNPSYVILQYESYDPGNHMNNGNYTVSLAGYYDLRAQVTFNDVNETDRFTLFIRNGTEVLARHSTIAGVSDEINSGEWMAIYVSTIAWLNKGDLLYLRVTIDNNDLVVNAYRNMYGDDDGTFTFFCVEYLGT